MKKSKKKTTILQINDTHGYLDIHQEMFWQGGHAVYRLAGGFARIASLIKQIRTESDGRVLFCDCGDTLHGTYPALKTQGEALIPILNLLNLDAMTAHWEFAYGPKVFQKRVSELSYPMIAINVYGEKTGRLSYPPYTAVFVTEQGLPKKYGRNREKSSQRAIDALRTYLSKHRPLRAELRGDFCGCVRSKELI